MKRVQISKFKATCSRLLDGVKRTGKPILVTRRGEPVAQIVPPSVGVLEEAWLGSFASTGRVVGDIVSPAADDRARAS